MKKIIIIFLLLLSSCKTMDNMGKIREQCEIIWSKEYPRELNLCMQEMLSRQSPPRNNLQTMGSALTGFANGISQYDTPRWPQPGTHMCLNDGFQVNSATYCY